MQCDVGGQGLFFQIGTPQLRVLMPEPKETTPQRKRYEPAWLAGTSVGDIMFQVGHSRGMGGCDG